MTPVRRSLWFAYALALVAPGVGRAIEKIASDTGGVASRFGPALLGVLIAAGVMAHCTAPHRFSRRVWVTLLAVAALAAVGLLALEAALLTVAPAPARVHAATLGAAILLAPALRAFGARATMRGA